MNQVPDFIRNIVIFIGGAVVGALVAKAYYKDIYEEISDEVEEELGNARASIEQYKQKIAMIDGIKEGLESPDNDHLREACRRVVENSRYGLFDTEEKPPLAELVQNDKDLRLVDEDEFKDLMEGYDYEVLVYMEGSGRVFNSTSNDPVSILEMFGERFEKKLHDIIFENQDSQMLYMISDNLKKKITFVKKDDLVEEHNIFDEYGDDEEDEEEDEYDEYDSDD